METLDQQLESSQQAANSPAGSGAASSTDEAGSSSSSSPKPAAIDPDLLRRFLHSNTKIQTFPVVEGLIKSSPHVVLKELQVVSSSESVRELIRNAEYARLRWRRLNIFSDVDYNLEPVADGANEDVVIRFIFNERKALKEIAVMTSESGTMPEAKASLQNVFGRGYELSCHFTPSTLRTFSYSGHVVSRLPFLGERMEYVVSKSSEPHALHYGDVERVEQARVAWHFDNSAELAWAEASAMSEAAALESTPPANATADAATTTPLSEAAQIGNMIEDAREEKERQAELERRRRQLQEELSAKTLWKHTVTYGFQRRRVVPKDSVPESVLVDGGGGKELLHWRGVPHWMQHHFAASTKAFLRYQVACNTVQYLPPPWFDVFALPVGGTNFCASAEVAGGLLGGETSLAKAEVQIVRHKTLFPFVVLDLSFRGGLAAGFGGSDWLGSDARWADIRMNDRFFLNWRNVRGFLAVGPNTHSEAPATKRRMNNNFNNNNNNNNNNDSVAGGGASSGPSADDSSSIIGSGAPPRRFRCLGGNAVWAASAVLNMPFPLWPSNGLVSAHIFANAGNLALVDNLSHLGSSLPEIFARPKASVGIGLTAMQIPSLGPVPNGRLELNLALPVNVAGGGAGGNDGTGGTGNPWVFDRVRWGLHWTWS